MLPFSAPFVFTFVSPFFNRQITFAHERSKVLKLVQHFGTRQKKKEIEKWKKHLTVNLH